MDRARTRKEELTMQEKILRDEKRRNEILEKRLRDIGFMYYAGTDPRRRQEIADGNMVQEDNRAPSNLPRQAIHAEYPKYSYNSNVLFDNSEAV